jgi:acylphosphatase
MLEELRIRLSGRVQGVGCRAAIAYLAADYAIKGWVANMPDGTVEIAAQGREDNIEGFIAALQRLPHPIRIDSLEKRKSLAPKQYVSFSIEAG